jgi:DNA-binding XRE family transcriptional regulator
MTSSIQIERNWTGAAKLGQFLTVFCTSRTPAETQVAFDATRKTARWLLNGRSWGSNSAGSNFGLNESAFDRVGTVMRAVVKRGERHPEDGLHKKAHAAAQVVVRDDVSGSLSALRAKFSRTKAAVKLPEARRDLADAIEAADGHPSLRSYRLRAGLTQQKLADLIDVAQPRIAELEAGKHSPRYEAAERLAGVLGISVGQVFSAFKASQNNA